MSYLIFKPALEKIEKIDNLVAAYREAYNKTTTDEGVKLSQWLVAVEECAAKERTLKTAITNFAKFLGYEIKPEYDYMEWRIELYERMKIRVTRMMEQLHEDDYYYSELKAI